MFFPYREWELKDIRAIDLRPLRSLQYPDLAYWTKVRTEAKVEMPETTRTELVYNLLVKVLSWTPALEALYLRLRGRQRLNPSCLRRLNADNQFIEQLDLQAQLFDDFCEGLSLPELPNLKTIGLLGGEPEWEPCCDLIDLFQSLFGSPDLHEVVWAQLDPSHDPTPIWQYPLRDWDCEDSTDLLTQD